MRGKVVSIVGEPENIDWVDIPAGVFSRGGGPKENELPVRDIEVSAFRLARAPVVREHYQLFLDDTGGEAPPFWHEPAFAHPGAPAVGPSWDDATRYCRWIESRGGPAVRLPTEAEWERAAKAGRDVLYPWGDEPPESLPDYAERWREGPEPVGAYPSLHPWGLLGMGENVHEWCADWYAADYYEISPRIDPQGPPEGRRRASRGGAWRHRIKGSRCAARSSIPPHMRYSDYGFRLASDPLSA